jgi:nucleoside-diphosphate-sugar epimerase
MVMGGTGLVGGYIVEQLVGRGERPLALSRSEQRRPEVDWFRGDLTQPDAVKLPPYATLYCTADAIVLADALPRLFSPYLRRIVIVSSTGVITKMEIMPLVGGAPGLRQPVHAEDLAIGAVAAASSPAAANKFYSLPGGETISYREMIGRIFDGLQMPRRTIYVPPLLWRAAFGLAKPLFPHANVAMGIRMMQDMTFDSTPAKRDFGWNPRPFKPVFE